MLLRRLTTMVLATLCCMLFGRTALAGSADVLYNFAGGSDGAYPSTSLLNVGGTFYGTTYNGGSGNCSSGCGTVFSITAGGVEHVIYSFQGGDDGQSPNSGLINVSGMLYGVTTYGGGTSACSSGCGTVFSIDQNGNESVVYRFQGGADGGHPQGNLAEVEGNLYGTTYSGGGTGCFMALGCGTVFRVSPQGAEKVLHAFTCGSDDAQPRTGLISVGNVLYGTTGGGICSNQSTPGIVFKINTAGHLITMHTFGVGNDGSFPTSAPVSMNGRFFGTTGDGGGSTTCNGGCGAVYEIKDGVESVLYAFTSTKGNRPAGLIGDGSILYGTAPVGGILGDGTAFRLKLNGTFTVLHAFGGKNDGVQPYAVISLGNVLYGVTSQGGTGGVGTVFKINE